MKQRRGWLWLTAGILLALLAGLMTFQIVNQLATTASVAEEKDTATVSVIVAVADIAPFVAINTGMVTLLDVPASMAPKEFVPNIEDVIGKMTLAPITLGEILVTPRLAEPTDPDSPVIYTMNPNEVLIALPSAALAGQLGLLSVGQHIDIAYTTEFAYTDENVSAENSTAATGDDPVPTTFLSLQNLQIKGLVTRVVAKEGTIAAPDAILLAVSPQEALILKYLIDLGAPMDILLRAPGNNSMLMAAPVDNQFLIDYFQLDVDNPLNLAINRSSRTSAEDVSQNQDGASQIQSLIQNQAEDPPPAGGE
jgi:Flp pilus assembly protein CpaB